MPPEGVSSRRERSLSNPENLLEFSRRTFSSEKTDYSWLTRESLQEILESTHILDPGRATKREKRAAKRRSSKYTNSIGPPAQELLHAIWCTKQYIAPAGSLLKEVLPLDVSSRNQKWVIYIMGSYTYYIFLFLVKLIKKYYSKRSQM